MKWEYEDRSTEGRLTISVNDLRLGGMGLLNPVKDTVNTFIYNKAPDQEVKIDGITYRMPQHSVLPLMTNQHFVFERPEELIAWQFNREFYCIVEHDSEVGCVGFLFYGIHHPLFITLGDDDLKSLNIIEQLFIEDIMLKDHMQGELLRTMLKRLIIKITRIAKKQTEHCHSLTGDKIDLVRKFNLLVEGHFKQQHDVQFYARAMNKSPKTLSNIFGMCHYPAPSKIIYKRILLEAMRYLQYTDKSAKEIAYELGFSTPAHFSRFFKIQAGRKISEVRGTEFQES